MRGITGQREANHWHLRCLIAGLAVLVIAVAMAPWNPTRGCGAPSATPPLIAFELATSPGDLAALFGPPGGCRDALVASFRVVNVIDYAFMAAYGAMLVAALAGFATGLGPARHWLIAATASRARSDADRRTR